MNSRLARLVALALLSVWPGPAEAALNTYVDFSGTNGESNPPGRNNVTELGSLTLAAGAFDAAKLVDATSPALQQAEVTATPFSSASLLFYDSLATDTQPDAQLVLHTALVTSIQSQLVRGNPGELVSVSFASPSVSLFLELPGVTGESSAPGHPGVIALDSITLLDGSFLASKAVDATSPALQSALLQGHPWATATLLVYSNVLSESEPDFELVYQQALESSIASFSLGDRPSESVAFDSTGVIVTPEPVEFALVLAGLAALLTTRGARRTRAGAR